MNRIAAFVLFASAEAVLSQGGPVNVQLQPPSQTACVGDRILVTLHAISDDATPDILSSLTFIFHYDSPGLSFIGQVDDADSPYPWFLSFFPNDSAGDGLNNNLNDGDFRYDAYGRLPPGPFPVATPGPTGLLVMKFEFELALPGTWHISVVPVGGPNSMTEVYDGTVPNSPLCCAGPGAMPSQGVILAPHPEIDAQCDDGLFCNGVETCDAGTCLPGMPLCAQGQKCCEETDTCGITCCSDSECQDGQMCNGLEACVNGSCQPGPPPVCPGSTECANGVCDPSANFGAGACIVVSKPDFQPCTDDGLDCIINVCQGGTCTAFPIGGCIQYLDATVNLSPFVIPDALVRCICFDLWTQCTPPESTRVCTEMTFGGPKQFAGRAHAVIQVPAGVYTCVSAFDPLHTTVSTDFTPFSPGTDTLFTVFAGDPLFGGNGLTQGNVDGSCSIDGADALTVTGLVGTNYGTGDTTCSTPAPHADFNGDGVVDAIDEGSVSTGLGASSTGCCESPTVCNGECTSDADCDDGNDCTVEPCTNGLCVYAPVPAGTACGDPSDTECDAPDTCEATSGCRAHWRYGPCSDDGNSCTKDVCFDGLCTHSAWPDGTVCINDENDCTDDVCIGGACNHGNDDTNACNDGLNCTDNDRCRDGACISDPRNCSDFLECTLEYCDEPSGGCVFVDINTIHCDVDDDCSGFPCDESTGFCICPVPGCGPCRLYTDSAAYFCIVEIGDALDVLNAYAENPPCITPTEVGISPGSWVYDGGCPVECTYDEDCTGVLGRNCVSGFCCDVCDISEVLEVLDNIEDYSLTPTCPHSCPPGACELPAPESCCRDQFYQAPSGNNWGTSESDCFLLNGTYFGDNTTCSMSALPLCP